MKWAHLSRPIPVIEAYPVISLRLLSGRRVAIFPSSALKFRENYDQ